MASLAGQARRMKWQVVQMDPPRRASRFFRHGEKLRSVHPDAFGILRRGEEKLPFFLEWERRAVRPVTMAARLAPYLRYYSSKRPMDEHGALPSVLIVFDEELAVDRLMRVAREETGKAGVVFPLMISHRGALERAGPLGAAWRSAPSANLVQAFMQSANSCVQSVPESVTLRVGQRQ